MYGLGSLLFGKKKNYDSDFSDDNSDTSVNKSTDYDIESASYLSAKKTQKKEQKKDGEQFTKTFIKPDISISTSGSFNDFEKINKPKNYNDSNSSINYKNIDSPISTPSSTPVNNSSKSNKQSDSDIFSEPSITKNIGKLTDSSNEDSKESGNDDVKLYNKKLEKINKWRTTSDDYEVDEFVDDEQSDSDIESDYSDNEKEAIEDKKEPVVDKKEQVDSDDENDKISLTSTNSKSSSKNKDEQELEQEQEPDHFGNYIIKESKSIYNHNSYYCQFLWSGIDHLDHWELQRKVTKEHAKQILIQMKKDYKSQGKFTFYDVVHLGIKPDGKYYVIDGQHRLVAYYNLFYKNQYPIQRVPAVVWETKTDDEFLEIYERINKRVPFDVTPFSKKILDIMFQMENYFGKGQTIWGKKRPKIDKILFVEEMKTNDDVHKLDADTIVKKIIDINIKIRGLPRSKRGDGKITSQVHTSAENMDFFLGYDKTLKWIHDIKEK